MLNLSAQFRASKTTSLKGKLELILFVKIWGLYTIPVLEFPLNSNTGFPCLPFFQDFPFHFITLHFVQFALVSKFVIYFLSSIVFARILGSEYLNEKAHE